MVNFLIIGICMIAGMLFRKSGSLPADAHKGINAWIIYLALPAVSFKYLPHIQWSTNLIVPAVAPVLVWLGAWLTMRLYAVIKKLDKKTEGGLKLAAGLSNTTFIGFPLLAAYYGEQLLGIAIIYDQVNFMILATAGVIVAVHSSKKEALTPAVILRRIFKFPPFLGCIAALTLPHFFDISPLDPLFTKLAATVGPLALFSIGFQIKLDGWRRNLSHISVALFYKLIVSPAIVFIFILVMGVRGSIAQVSVFEAAMPTLLTAGIVADEYDLDPQVVNLVIGIGILLSFLTTAGWWLILRFVS